LKRIDERSIAGLVVATGISSVVAQLLTIREFLTQFNGNEFVIAMILFVWLALGGAGTILARLADRRTKANLNCLALLSLFVVCLPSIQILAIRGLRDAFFIQGTSVGFYQTFAYIFFLAAPYCLVIGFVLPYSLFVIRTTDPDYSGTRIYLQDNLGDMAGGILFSFILVYFVTPLQAVFLANLPLFFAVTALVPCIYKRHPGMIVGLCLSFIVLMAGVVLEPGSLAPEKGKLAYYSESRFGRVVVHKNQEQYTLFEDGVPGSSSQHISMAEEAIHYPLSQTENPERILLISGESGMLAEIKKYSPQSVDYVELNPEVSYVQTRLGLIRDIPGLNIVNQDGRFFLARTNKIYDAIIVHLPEPETFQINRFYTDKFFALARQHLSGQGVLSFSMQGFDNYLGEPQRRKLSSLFNTVSDSFDHVLMIPGQKIFFLCSARPIQSYIPSILNEKKIETVYIKGFYHGNVTAERITSLNSLVDPAVPKNRDRSPQIMRLMFQQWFEKHSTSPLKFIIVLSVVCLVYLFRMTREEFVLFSTGFMVMGSELLVIFAFQIFFGYIYFQIGMIVTFFLAGLLPGAYIGGKIEKPEKKMMVASDALLMGLMCIFLLVLHLGGEHFPPYFYLLFGFSVSLACGYQFPVALGLQGSGNLAATRFFSADLIGAAVGIFLTSAVLIPYWGIVWAAAALILLKAASMMVIGIHHEKH